MAVVSSCCECWVKSRNERNPYLFVASGPATGNSKETASDKLEEGGMTSSHGPYDQGYTRATMAHKEKRPRESKRTS